MHNASTVAAALSLFALGACAEMPEQSALPPTMTIAAATTTTLADGTIAPAPPGFVSFCMHNLEVCTNKAPAQNQVVLDDNVRAKLVAVNNQINDAIVYETDARQYGVANLWTLNAVGGFGNCKDYALAKRQALIAAGFPENALRIAIVRTPQSELHAVLTVDTDRGDFVLDSLTPEIQPWSETHYSWLSRQSAGDPLRWVHLTQNIAYAQ